MARTTPAPAALAPQQPDDTTSPEELLEELGDIFASAGPGSALYLFRTHPRPPGARVEAFLEMFDAPPTLSDVRDAYGGGTFRLRLLAGGKRTKHSVLFSIEGRPRFRDEAGGAGGASPGDTTAEESRLDRIERLLELSLAGKRSSGDEDDDAEFRRMMNRAIMARTIAEQTRESPLAGLRELLEVFETLRGEAPPAEAGPPWLGVAERAVQLLGEAMKKRPQAVQVSPPAPARQVELAPAEPSTAEVDAFLALLAHELEQGAPVERLMELVPADQIGSFVSVTPVAWLDVLKKASARWPVFDTMPARMKLSELLRRLHAAARAASQHQDERPDTE